MNNSAIFNNYYNLGYTQEEIRQLSHCGGHAWLSLPTNGSDTKKQNSLQAINWVESYPNYKFEKGKYGLNLTALSIITNHYDFYKCLVEKGFARFFEKDNFGNTAFTLAKEAGDPRFIILFNQRIQILYPNQAQTEMEKAVWERDAQKVTHLLELANSPYLINPDTGLSPIQLAEVIEQPTMGNNSEMIGVFKKHCSKLELTPDEYIQGHSQLLINQERIIASLQTQLNSAYAQLYPPSHRGIREESKEASSQSSNQSQPAAYLSTQARPSATENDCGIM